MAQPRIQKKKADQYHHGDLRRALLVAGEQLLAKSGPEGLSLREVAQRAGVSHAAPYRHFASKEALLAALAEQGFRELATELRAAHGRDALQTLQAQGVGYVRFALAHPAQVRVMFRAGVVSGEHPELKATADEAFGLLVQGVVACQELGVFARGDPLPLATSCWALSHGLALLMLDGALGFPREPLAAEQFARDAVGQLLRGMKR